MSFGNNIKKLRRERGITQDQLANALGISGQAVSRWETGAAMPDISLIPALSNYFNVSSDFLLDINVDGTPEGIDSIKDQLEDMVDDNLIITTARYALKKYPRDAELMYYLAASLMNRAVYDENKTEMYEEAASLCRKILDISTVNYIRHGAVDILCNAYARLGKREEAIELARSMPLLYQCKEKLMTEACIGDQQYRWKCKYISALIFEAADQLRHLNTVMDDGNTSLNMNEWIEAHKKILALYDVLFEDGDFGEYRVTVGWIYFSLFSLYYPLGDIENAFECFKKAVDLALSVDKDNDEGLSGAHTSILIRGEEYNAWCKGFCSVYLKFLREKTYFEDLQNDSRFAPLIEQLKAKEE
ncbi:MAG: helix-turn-helix transcriptional regulator [Clostridia bacterium]|nr:helix-turn-helix transcriptional regulator [Clostridia bacterium]